MHESYFIRKPVTQRIFNAFDYAESMGKPLNYYVVIHLNDFIGKAAYTAIRELFTKYRRWLEHKRRIGVTNCPPLYVFTQENPNKNPHLNWCLHIPEELKQEFEAKLIVWISKVEGEPDYHKVRLSEIDHTRYKLLAKYILKGTDPEFIDKFYLRGFYDSKGPQGPVFGCRAGSSRALGVAAIKRAEFVPTAYRHSKRRFYQ